MKVRKLAPFNVWVVLAVILGGTLGGVLVYLFSQGILFSPKLAVEISKVEEVKPEEPSPPPQETPSPVIEEAIEEAIEETTAEEIKEFTAEMIKHRLWLEGKELPMWYVREYGCPTEKCDEYIVSAVVAGPPKFDQGELEETLVPVAFQSPKNGKFFIRDLTLGPTTPPYDASLEEFSICNLTNWQFYPEDPGLTGYTLYFYFVDIPSLLKRLHPGDQIAFTLIVSLTPGRFSYSEEVPPEIIALDKSIIDRQLSNNLAMVKAMQQNKDLPKVTVWPSTFFINEENSS